MGNFYVLGWVYFQIGFPTPTECESLWLPASATIKETAFESPALRQKYRGCCFRLGKHVMVAATLHLVFS